MPRLLAVKMLDKTFTNNGFSNIVVDKSLSSSNLSIQDKRLCSVIYYGVLERKITLDYIISRYSKKSLNKLDISVLNILRSGIYQILYLDSIPDNASVNESVKLAKKLKVSSASGFINAVLRNFIRDGKTYPLPKDALKRLSIEYSAPQWLVDKLLIEYSKDVAINMLKSSIGKVPTFFRINNTLCTDEECIKSLGLECKKIEYLPHCYELLNGDITSTEVFKKGFLHIQDISSQMCCSALNPKENDIVLDICSAPGGKTFTISETMNNTGKVYAFDLHQHRVDLISQGAKRLHLTNIVSQVGDGSKFNEKLPQADKILCDVPCSGLGVIRRKPEIKYKNPKEFDSLPNIQYKILETSSKYLKVGGELVYSTCTLNKAENEEIIEKFLKENPNFEGVSYLESLGEPFGNYKTTINPKYFNGDGFFISKVKRVK
ncbi:MAG: 16S rRNA (cytosine(967)-C(5))-methyltransferase RsmB [Ruminococcus sp.]|nr:16S rRNA (cytosine(967)-C(5))-methyltransferase RsmB [Ruminococcus sp.]